MENQTRLNKERKHIKKEEGVETPWKDRNFLNHREETNRAYTTHTCSPCHIIEVLTTCLLQFFTYLLFILSFLFSFD